MALEALSGFGHLLLTVKSALVLFILPSFLHLLLPVTFLFLNCWHFLLHFCEPLVVIFLGKFLELREDLNGGLFAPK